MNQEIIGKRIEMVEMIDDPRPIERGEMGTITWVGGDTINVNWDNGRVLGVIINVDKFIIHEQIK